MQDTRTQVVAVYGNTFPAKDRLKELGFRFRRTSSSTLRGDGDNAILDAGFGHDTPIWVIGTDDVDGTLAQLADFDGLKIKVDGKSLDTASDTTTPPAPRTGEHPLAFVPDTEDHLFDGAPMHGIRD